jgi:hypothetical protein
MAQGTILVNLERDWFAPDASLYQVRDNPHEFPAHWEDQIPRIKKPARDTAAAAPLPAAPEVKYEVDKEARDRIIVKDAKTVAVVQNTGGGERVIVPTAVEGDVKSVGGALDDKGHEKSSQSVASAQKGAKELEVEVGGKPRESGPLPAGTKKPA